MRSESAHASRRPYLITRRRKLVASAVGLAVVVWICFSWAVARHTEAPGGIVSYAPNGHSAADADPKILRVCADPDNLPYANVSGEGFDNAIAALLALELRRTLEYSWQPRRRGYVQATLHARVCDVVMNVPVTLERVRTTRPYYRSTYVFLTRRDRGLRLRSYDDWRLDGLRTGIQVAGDEYDNPPVPLSLAARQFAKRLPDATIYRDDAPSGPRRSIVDAVARGDIDVGIVWGPLAGYLATRKGIPLTIAPVESHRGQEVTFAFDMSLGVRPEDTPLHAALDAAIARRASDIYDILRRYGVPLVTGT